ncbi:MAG: PIN domain-containing protein, partial [Acidobacteria bacterium]|nr:PIN domain-containing protein [Acidobacteriota bacterium]
MIVADTGAIVALVDAGDRHHEALRGLYDDDPDGWVLPWAILPEVDYLLATHVSVGAQQAWLADLATAAFAVEWGRPDDLAAAERLCRRHKALHLGLVDAVVMVVAERTRADAIATLDLRHFGAVRLKG